MIQFATHRATASPGTRFEAGRDRLATRVRLPFAGALLDPLLGLGDLERLWTRALCQSSAASIFDALLHALDVQCAVEQKQIERLPQTGPLAIVANHPCGLLEGPAIGSAIYRRRKDVRFLANSILTSVPELKPYVIPVEIFGEKTDVKQNAGALLTAYRWLREGGVLVVFPAGEVSSMQLRQLRITDRAWDDRLFRLFRSARATLLPAYVSGSNSLAFHLAGMVNPALRTMLLGRELLNKQSCRMSLEFGTPVRPDRISTFGSDLALSNYLRARTYVLHHRQVVSRPVRQSAQLLAPIIAPVRTDVIRKEIESLSEGARLSSGGSLSVYIARTEQIPNAFEEISRLREITFRSVGEGTGKKADRDDFDSHYEHLVLWDQEAGTVAGAYRMARIDHTLAKRGLRGLYSHTLFRFDPVFIRRIHNGIELGRSFVRVEYQRDYQPLYLLWKAIAAFVARNPTLRYLMGPATISARYSRAARELIMHYCAAHHPMSTAVQPRHKLSRAVLSEREIETLGHLIGEPGELSEVISDIEADGKPLPVLLRHYLALGGEVLGFNVDREFSGELDGLVLVDLLTTRQAILDRYMGRQAAESYRAFHRR